MGSQGLWPLPTPSPVVVRAREGCVKTARPCRALMMSMQTPGPLDDPGQLPGCGILPYLFLGSQLLTACPPRPSLPLSN